MSKKTSKVTREQLAIPRRPRDDDPTGGYLSSAELLLMQVIGILEVEEGVCKASNLQLAEAMGLSGSRENMKRQIHILFRGRMSRGKRYPGLVERGWIEIQDDGDYENWTRRRIIRTSKWSDLARGVRT